MPAMLHIKSLQGESQNIHVINKSRPLNLKT